MMKFKKFLAAAMTGAMMLGVVASAVPATSVYAVESNTPATGGNYDIEIDYKSMTAKITLKENAQKDPYVKLVVIKKGKEAETDEKKASSGIYTYAYPSSGSLTVDLSFLKLTKDPVEIRVYGSSEEFAKASKATVNAQSGKIALSYTGGTGNITQAFKEGKGKNATAVTADVLATYEFRTLYGSEFKDLTTENFNVSITETAGTTLIVRKKAVTTGDTAKQCAASPEIKVKIAAAPKAPSIKIDYAKGTIGSLKNTKVEIYTTSGAAIEVKGTNVSGSAISFGDKVKALTPEEILKEGSITGAAATPYLKSGFILVVRTVKTGKADSNAAIVSIPAAGELVKDPETDKISLNNKTLEWKWGPKKAGSSDEGVIITTSANKDFEYEVEKNGTKSWKSLKKDDFLALKDGAILRVRLAGDKNATPPTLPSIPYEITVKKVEKLAIDKTSATIKVNGTEGTTLKVTLGTTDVTNQVVWEVKKGETASTDLTVTNGVIKKAENATLTKDAKYTLTGKNGDQTVTVEVTVVE